MELKFKEVNDDYMVTIFDSNEDKILIKPFLTIEELNTIVGTMKEQDTQLAKHYAKVVQLIDFCTNIDIKGMKNNEIYNLASKLRLIDILAMEIDIYHDIDTMVEKDKSIYDLLSAISQNLQATIENVGSDSVNTIDKIKEVMDIVDKK